MIKLSVVLEGVFCWGILAWGCGTDAGGGVLICYFGLSWEEGGWFWDFGWVDWVECGRAGPLFWAGTAVGGLILWLGCSEVGDLGALWTLWCCTCPLMCLTISALLNLSIWNSLFCPCYLNFRILTKIDPLTWGTVAPKLLMSIHAILYLWKIYTFSLPSGI